jgi:hypothetical protein
MTSPLSIEEFQAQYDDPAPEQISMGALRTMREAGVRVAGRLGTLQAWVDLYLNGKASVDELTHALGESGYPREVA